VEEKIVQPVGPIVGVAVGSLAVLGIGAFLALKFRSAASIIVVKDVESSLLPSAVPAKNEAELGFVNQEVSSSEVVYYDFPEYQDEYKFVSVTPAPTALIAPVPPSARVIAHTEKILHNTGKITLPQPLAMDMVSVAPEMLGAGQDAIVSGDWNRSQELPPIAETYVPHAQPAPMYNGFSQLSSDPIQQRVQAQALYQSTSPAGQQISTSRFTNYR